MNSLRPLCLIMATIFCAPLQVSAQEPVICASGSSDADGDGWGWENNTSCRVSAASSQNNLICVDTDGDGYGWDGTASCLIDESASVTPLPGIASASCVDSDGDGYGWDGTATCIIGEPVTVTPLPDVASASCIDSDGDGYGWDGTATCIIDEPAAVILPGQEFETEPYVGRYGTSTDADWGFRSGSFQNGPVSNAITNGWIEGSPDAPLGFPDTYTGSLVSCEDPDITLQDPSNPGLFFDAALGKACAKSRTLAIPAPGPVEFTAIGVEVLYENGNQWSCIEEDRPAMDSEFQPNGRVGSMTFNLSGSATVRVGNQVYTDGWDMSGINLSLSSFRASSTLHTPVAYTDDGLTLYRSGLTRLQCERVVENNFPFRLYGEDKAERYRDMWDAFIGDSTPTARLTTTSANRFPDTDFPQLSGNELAGRTLECGGVYGRGTLGVDVSTEETVDTVTALGGDEYDFSGAVWTETSNGVFSQSTGSGGSERVFYRYSDNLLLRYTFWSGAIGSSVGNSTSVAACEL